MTEPAISAEVQNAVDIADKIVFEGMSFAESQGLSEDELEALYGVAYNLYNQGQYDDSDKLFRLLCFLDHLDRRFWMGLGAVRQSLKRHADAIEAYSVAAVLDTEDPVVPLHAAECFLALGRLEEADSAITGALHYAGNEPRHKRVRDRAEALQQALQRRKGGIS
jgi:type III secretion system low calcium response chaperone LcrH/SycD